MTKPEEKFTHQHVLSAFLFGISVGLMAVAIASLTVFILAHVLCNQ